MSIIPPLFRDENNKPSMTRFVLFFNLVMFIIAGFMEMFNNPELSDYFWSIIQMIFVLTLSGTAVRSSVKNFKNEKFSANSD